MYCCLLTTSLDIALAVARSCSPRVASHGDAVVFDVTGCTRTIGPLATITREVAALVEGFKGGGNSATRVAVAPTVTAAWLLAHARPGTTVARPGAEARALAGIPAGWLGTIAHLDGPKCTVAEVRDVLAIVERWGLPTLGDLAALPQADVRARLGPLGVRLHQAAGGQDVAPFVPMEEATRFTDRVELEWPIEGLEPLAFVLARSCERLSAVLGRADRGAVAIRTELRLVTRETHARVLEFPTPMTDARMLRTLILLDLESHPPPAAIDIVSLDLDVSPGPVVQESLFAPTLPLPEDLATLMARLGALMGASRVGAPEVRDTHDARAVGMGSFRVPVHGSRHVGRDGAKGRVAPAGTRLPPVVRRFRLPVAARVDVERSAPVRVVPAARGLAGGLVVTRAGPWRSSGGWWALDGQAWDRDEWDVALAGGTVYRLARDRASGQWQIEGVLD